MPQRQPTLRPARADEAHVLASLVNDAYGRTETQSGWTSEDEILAGPRVQAGDVERMLDREASTLLAAEVDGDLVGCVHLEQLDDGDCELGLLSVRPSAQANGLGRSILRAGERFASDELDADRVVLKVISRREKLLAWYERRGYEPTGESRRFEPEAPQRSLVGPLSFDVLVKRLD